MWIYLSSLPTDFREFEQRLYAKVIEYVERVGLSNVPNIVTRFYIGNVRENFICFDFIRLTLSELLTKRKHTDTYYFIYDIEQRRLMPLPNEGNQYLDFFKDFYEILTRYWRLNDDKRAVIDDLLCMYTHTSISTIINCRYIYKTWQEHPETIELAKTLLKGATKAEFCKVCSHEVCKS